MIEDDQPLSPAARAKIKALREDQRRDRRMVMSPADAELALGVKGTRIAELMSRGELDSILRRQVAPHLRRLRLQLPGATDD